MLIEHLIDERSESDAKAQRRLAEVVGTGAVKYVDPSMVREKDNAFTWSRMLATDSNTSVYLQNTNARVHSVSRSAAGTPIALNTRAERAQDRKLT